MKATFSSKRIWILLILVFVAFTSIGIGITLAKYVSVELVGSFNLHVEPAPHVFAVYSADDHSLTFYNDVYPEEGTEYNDKTATAVYHDHIEAESYTPEWSEVATSVKSVRFEHRIAPISVKGWFSDFKNAISIDLTNLDTSNTVNTVDMFKGCDALETLTIGESFGSSEQTLGAQFPNTALDKVASGWIRNSDNAEINCENISMGVANTYTAVVNYCYATYGGTSNGATLRIYQRRIIPKLNAYFTEGDGEYVTNIYSWRNGDSTGSYTTCKGGRPVRDANGEIYDTWAVQYHGSKITDILSVEVIDNAKPLSLDSWFKDFSNIGRSSSGGVIDLHNLDTSDAVSMRYMFFDCNQPATIDVSNFNTAKVEDMSYMFSKCWELQSLDLSSFDTSSVKNMSYMFNMKSTTGLYSSKLTTIYVSSAFVTTNVENSRAMFTDCKLLVGGNNTSYATAQVTDGTYAVIDEGEQKGYFTLRSSA